MMSERSPLIIFEGLGGVGKGTQLKMTRDWLEISGYRPFVTCEHCIGTPTGDLIEAIIKGRLPKHDPTALQLLYVADRAQHTKNLLIPCLTSDSKFDFGLGDRYEASTVAYAPNYQREFFLDLNQRVTIAPDLTIILDLDPEECVRRIKRRGGQDMFDRVDSFRRVRGGYQWYAEHSNRRCSWVDASGSPVEVFERVKTAIVENGILRRKK